jgi:23S rRNA G2445 N2-methylase RlmL
VEGVKPNGVHEILHRTRCAEDVEWIAHDSRCHDLDAFDRALDKLRTGGLLPKGIPLKISVDSKGSMLFHESSLRDRAEAKLGAQRTQGSQGEQGSMRPDADAEEFLLRVRLRGNRLRLCLSLARAGLGKRGYKESVGVHAPLREEQAACCFEALRAAFPQGTGSSLLWIPFAGSGTLGFEGLQALADVCVAASARILDASLLPFWSEKTWLHLGKRRDERIARRRADADLRLAFLERDPEVAALLRRNAEAFSGHAPGFPTADVRQGDFFAVDPPTSAQKEDEALVVAINPPYGMRLPRGERLHARIAQRLLPLARGRTLTGFLLCPTEEDWRDARNLLAPHGETRTRHFMQGGLDVRVLMFRLS